MNNHRIESRSRSLVTPERPADTVPPSPRIDIVARVLGAPASRRSVLGTLLAVLLASRLPRVGTAARQEVVCPCPSPPCFLRAWGQGPNAGGQFHLPFGVAVAPDGTVYVADTLNHRIQYFDDAGTFLGMWGSEGRGTGQFVAPSAVAVTPDGTMIYVVDADNHRIQVFDVSGAFQGEWGSEGRGAGQFAGRRDDGDFPIPASVAVAPDGTVYVGDAGNHRIQYFNRAGTYLGAWGSNGTGDGQFDFPFSVAVAPDGTVYVADTSNHRVQYFDATGTYLGQWGGVGSGPGQFDQPAGVTVAPDGTVYVTDGGHSAIQAFDASGSYLGGWGGQFFVPTGVAVAPDGQTVYVADTGGSRIHAFCVAPVIRGERQHATPEIGTPSAPDEPDR
jgi:tripartite motif-containing protein 71